MEERTCKGCPAALVPGPRERRKREWCSQACRQRWLRSTGAFDAIRDRRQALERSRAAERRGDCPFCGTPLPPGRRSACEARECQKKRHAARAREAYAADPIPKRKQTAEYRRKQDPELLAQAREQWVAYLRANRDTDAFKEARRANDARRRARKVGATVEKFKHVEIFERDDWVCGICSGDIDPSLSYPDPMSVSLDHVLPLARGGDHSRANTRASHLRCNIVRHVGRGESQEEQAS